MMTSRARPPGALPLTGRQAEILAFIRRYMIANGAPPSLREIATEFGFESPNGAKCHLTALRKKGAIRPATVGSSRQWVPVLRADGGGDAVKRPDGCICVHPNARECLRWRRQVWDSDRDEVCECSCHRTDPDGFTDWDDDETRERGLPEDEIP